MTKRFGGFCNGDKNMWNGIPLRKRPERIVAVWVRGETTQLFTCPGLSFVLIRGHLQSGEKVFYIHIFIFRKYMNSSVWRYQGGSSLYNVFIHTTTSFLDKWPKRKKIICGVFIIIFLSTIVTITLFGMNCTCFCATK